MKRLTVVSMVAAFLILVGVITVINSTYLDKNEEQKPFYVGVTYCGNNTQEAKLLIDKVKNYTNLFVLQSGPLMRNEAAVTEIGDYAISCGLHFAAFFESGALFPPQEARWLGIAEKRWGSMFAGLYFGDEPGGKMLDTNMDLTDRTSNLPTNGTASIALANATKTIVKLAGGGLQTTDGIYFPNGTISIAKSNSSYPDFSFWHRNSNDEIEVFYGGGSYTTVTYNPNGSITIEEVFASSTYYSNGTINTQELSRNFLTIENGTDRISQLESYKEMLSRHPIPNCDVAAEKFVNNNRKKLDGLVNQWQLSNRSFPIFTADYALFWWDFQSGYDLVLAELGWNNTVAQEIGLVRGAANLQGKRWGVIITWTYTQPPYLTSGSEMYEQMRMSYESGAEYVIIFNYAEDMEGPYGTLQDEHFDALERFWNEVVRNPAVVHGGIKAEASFVLPKNYGWGLRNTNDIVWGLWEPTTEARQAWTLLQDALTKHDLRLEIVYDDSAYPIARRYRQIYYWNQTG